MTEIDTNVVPIEEKIGIPFDELRAMVAESCGATYDSRLLHVEELQRGIGLLGIQEMLCQTDIGLLVSRHTSEQLALKRRFDLPFSEAERAISRNIFDTLAPLKHPDQYATDDRILEVFSDRGQKSAALTILGRLGTRRMLEVGNRYARKKKGNFHYTKWPTSAQRREYIHRSDHVVGSLKEPFELDSIDS